MLSLVKGGTLSASTTVTAVKVVAPDGSVRDLGAHPSFEPVFPDTLLLNTFQAPLSSGSYAGIAGGAHGFAQVTLGAPASGGGVRANDFTGFTHLGTALVPDTTRPIYQSNISGTHWYLWQPQGWLGRYILSTTSAANDWWIGGNSSGLGTGSQYREGVLHAGHWYYNHGTLNPWDSAFQNYWGLFNITGTGSATDWALSLGQGNNVQPGDHLQIVTTSGGVSTTTLVDLPADITRPVIGTAPLAAVVSASDAAGHALSPSHTLAVGDVVHISVPVSESVAIFTITTTDSTGASALWPGVDNAVVGLDIGGVTRWANLDLAASRQGNADHLIFNYTIANGDTDSTGGLHVGALDARFTRFADAYGNRIYTTGADLPEVANTWQVHGTGTALSQQPTYVQALVPGPHWPDSSPTSGVQGDAVTTLTYAYYTDWPSYYATGELPNAAASRANTPFKAWTSGMKTLLGRVFNALSTYANITFTEEKDDPSQAHIAMGSYAMASGIGGYGYYPDNDSSAQVGNEYGDLWINSNANLNGTWIRYAIAHEIGHTLGLKHPGNYNAGGGGTDGPYLDNTTDNDRYSVMSYNDAAGLTQYPNDYMLYDIAALQYLYGARAFNTGDTAISITYPTSGAQWDVTDMIYDTGGIDTLSVSGTITGGVTLDLVQGEFCSIGAVQNYGICFGTVIENAVGTPKDDTFIGNNANNTFTGGGGADTFVFGPEWGQDTITDFDPANDRISFARDATITRASLTITAVSANGANSAYTLITHGSDTLTLIGVTQLPDTAIAYVL